MKTRNHLIVSHCIVHHLVEVARIIVVHYSNLLRYMDDHLMLASMSKIMVNGENTFFLYTFGGLGFLGEIL